MAERPPQIGDTVTVIGFPAGITGMLARSLPSRAARMMSGIDSLQLMRKLAKRADVRPITTYGHLGDVTGERLIYDAHTARGSSGGPVLNDRGEVIGMNAAYIEDFGGGNIGVPVSAVRSLLEAATRRNR
jgi:S1-C subfamily serine protease